MWQKWGTVKGASLQKGGIDLTKDRMHMQVNGQGEQIKFNITPAQLQQWLNAVGCVPVNIKIKPGP